VKAPEVKIPEKTVVIKEENTSTNEIDTSNWKTYKNEEYGFEIKYPGYVSFTTTLNERTDRLNPMKKSNEMGKVRPALIFQNDKLNLHYPSVIIIPLSSDLVDDAEPIRFRINKRDKLYKDSDLVLTQIRAIDKSRLIEKVGSLTKLEFEYIKKLFLELL